MLFHGRRIWSIPADAAVSGLTGSSDISWPPALRPHLDGRAEVQVVDEQGRPLASTKWGRLNHPFGSTDRSAIKGYLDHLEEVLAALVLRG